MLKPLHIIFLIALSHRFKLGGLEADEVAYISDQANAARYQLLYQTIVKYQRVI